MRGERHRHRPIGLDREDAAAGKDCPTGYKRNTRSDRERLTSSACVERL
jgi:hypothetical protein